MGRPRARASLVAASSPAGCTLADDLGPHPSRRNVGEDPGPEEDPLNQPEIGIRKIQIVFSKDVPPKDLWCKGITAKGTLFSAHTGHHRRRVLMMAHPWKPIDLQSYTIREQNDNRMQLIRYGHRDSL